MNQGTVTIGANEWGVWVAALPDELAQGLGNLASIPANAGMLFDMGYECVPTVTTHPMLFNIDIVFVDSNFQVLEVHENIAPGNEITPGSAVQYFMEVNAGEAASVNAGDSVAIMITEVTSPTFSVQAWGAILATAALVILPMVGNWLEGVIEKEKK